MTIYCPKCTGLYPLEMEQISHNMLRCPRCLHTRRVTPHMLGPCEIEDISHAKAQQEIAENNRNALKTVAIVGAVAIGLALLLGGSGDSSEE